MVGYVARDLNESLWFHYSKPHRKGVVGRMMYWDSDEKCFQIHDDDFPEFKDLKWQDKPVRVGFQIHKTDIQD